MAFPNERGQYGTPSPRQPAPFERPPALERTVPRGRGQYGGPSPRKAATKSRAGLWIMGAVSLGLMALAWRTARVRKSFRRNAHAEKRRDWTPGRTGQNLTPKDVAPQLQAVTQAAQQPMATELHPRVSLSTQSKNIHKESFERKLKAFLGKDVTLEEISHALAPPKGYTGVFNRVDVLDGDGDVARIGMVIKNAKGDIVGSLKHYFSKDGVEYNLIELDEAVQGSGIINSIHGQSLLRYEKLGVPAIELSADWVGKYAWASMGFSFKDEKQALEDINKFLERRFTGAELAQKREEAEELVKEPWNLARWDDGSQYETNFKNRTAEVDGKMQEKIIHARFPLGKAILLDGGNTAVPRDGFRLWKGRMEIDRNNPGYLNALKRLKVEEKA